MITFEHTSWKDRTSNMINHLYDQIKSFKYCENNTYWLYFLKYSEDTVKIGRGKHIFDRIKRLQTTAPEQLELLFLFYEIFEDVTHEKFKHLRTSSEFFIYNSEIKNYIKLVKKLYTKTTYI